MVIEEYRKRYPWITSYSHAKQRCTNKNHANYKYYGGKGIKFLMTSENFKQLWNRDRADLMTRPSIDRIDSNKDYTIDNCRFIEMSINSGLATTGEKQWRSKLNNEKVLEIRKYFATGNYTYLDLSKIYKVSSICIGRIIRRVDWKHI